MQELIKNFDKEKLIIESFINDLNNLKDIPKQSERTNLFLLLLLKNLRGLDGKDGLNGQDGINGLNGLDGKDGIDGKDGLNGIDGKDAEATQIIDTKEIIKEAIKAIKELKGNERLDISNIKNSEQLIYGNKKKIDTSDERWHGAGSGNMFNTVLTITNSTTLPIGGGIFFINASAGPVTLNLPTANGQLGYVYKIKKVDTSSNTVTIEPYGSETIDDDTNIDVADYNNAPELVSDNTNWKIM